MYVFSFWQEFYFMHTNGPAIKFSRCYLTQYRAGSSIFSQNVVTVQGRYGAFFAVRLQILLSITSVALQIFGRAGCESRYTIFIESSGAVWICLVLHSYLSD